LAADRLGGRWLYGGCVLLSSVATLLTPAAARVHIGVLITLRVLSGLGEGTMLPAVHALIARWSTPRYRSLVVNAIFVGMEAGAVVGTLLTGVLCDHAGWPSAFYVFGTVGCVWSAAWFFLCHDSPPSHPRISTAELQYWERTIGSDDLAGRPPTPWRRIISSVPVWALAVAFFAADWGYYTFVICLPLYMRDVLGFNMTWNGLFSALACLAPILVAPVCGLLSDWMSSSGRLSTTAVRKGFCVVGFTAAGCLLVVVGYVGCDRHLAVAIILAIMACTVVAYASVLVNQLDLAPLHAGKIMGLTNGVASVAAIAAPLAVGALTYDRSTRDEWQQVFFLAAAIYAVGAVVFLIFGSGKRQSWAD